jgi:hypothetical protein
MGDAIHALDALETAEAQRDPQLIFLRSIRCSSLSEISDASGTCSGASIVTDERRH